MTDGGDRGDYRDTGGGSGELDAELQRELDEALGDMSLMDLVDEPRKAGQPTAAEGVRLGVVVAIQQDDLLVDMGGKSTGVLPIRQMEGEPLPAVGDTIEVTITGYNGNEGLLLLSRKDAVMAASWGTLEEGQSVEGRVTGHNKGGLELKIDGIKAFMPISQIALERIEEEDMPAFVDQRLRCQVMEVRRNEESLVVSRRMLLKEEAAQASEQMFAELVEGAIVTGTVRTIMPYGAFVDIGGVDGLLHVRDMGYARVEKPEDVVSPGQKLELKVLRIDREEKKIALGLKQVMADPWTDAASKWPVDTIVSGRVTRLMDFGAFVELVEGVEGLIPISEMSFERRINHPKEVVNENDVVKVRVLSVDIERGRIGLSLKRVGDDPWVGASVRWPENTACEGIVKRITEFGAFVELAPGVEGLVHISELAEHRVSNVSEVVKDGETVQVMVLDVDEDRRRIALSIKQLSTMPEYTGPESAEPEPSAPKRKRKKPLRGGLEW